MAHLVLEVLRSQAPRVRQLPRSARVVPVLAATELSAVVVILDKDANLRGKVREVSVSGVIN